MDGLMNDEELIKKAKDLLETDKSAWSDTYRNAKEDLDFQSDDEFSQWDSADVRSRQASGRPAIQVDQLSQYVHQVVNDVKMNTPSINILPGDGGDIETADIIKGLVRNIEYESGADDAYDTGLTSAVKCSFGFLRIDHEYAGEIGLEQKLVIKRVHNPLSVYIDSSSTECDGRDAKHGFVIDIIKVSEFKELYPGRDPVSFGETKAKVTDDETVDIVEFFIKEEEEKEIGAGEDGSIAETEAGKEYKSRRKIKKTKILRYKLSGSEILEKTTFPGKYIPIVPVYGEEAWNGNERGYLSLIRKAKPAARMFNFMKSNEIEVLMKQPQAPIIAPAGAVENYAKDYKDPTNSVVLRYDTLDARGNPIPPPTRLQPPAIPAGFVNAGIEAAALIKATMGMYGASLGERTNETSGRAIMSRQREGDVATYHFGDNLIKSITQAGRIIVSALGEIYDTSRVLRIIGVEGEPKSVGINGKRVEGQERDYDLTQGSYDVKVTTGASFTTRRQEAAQFFTEIVTRQPELMQVAGDLLFKNMDFPGADALSARMKKLVPPNLLSDEDKKANEVDPEKQAMQAQMAQMQEQMALLQRQLEDKALTAENDRAKLMLEGKKVEIDAFKAESDVKLRTAELAMQANPAPQQAFSPKSTGGDGGAHDEEEMLSIEELQALLDRRVKQRADDAASEAQQQEDLMRQRMLQEQEEAAKEQQKVQQQAAFVSAIVDAVNGLTQAVTTPKHVVRDSAGKVVGVQ